VKEKQKSNCNRSDNTYTMLAKKVHCKRWFWQKAK